MTSLLHPLLFLPFIFSLTSSKHIPMPYVVYMGSLSKEPNQLVDVQLLQSSHLQLLASIIPREESERIQLIHHYHHAFKGFSAMLTEKEASLLSGHEEIVSVFPDPVLELHTTRSWDFLKENSGIFSHLPPSNDIIIGIVDTGIWPESPSFSDEAIGKIPSRWKGTCMEGPGFNKSSCN
ncbi:CO(2)-response secreted protease-like, partial [Carica papaya]|uniref:CO(2)-response secreted protease-like n=1 Tax=Carica papaya TaxID=3649 RepID=UPI000B8CC85A